MEQLADDLYRRQVLRARATPVEDKLLAGPRLFDRSCRVMADALRSLFPEADEQQIDRMLRDRLALIRRLETSR